MKEQRLKSLDALRGFDMLFIMGFSGLVASLCRLFPGTITDELALQMQHVSWNGLSHHDTIFPLFLFLAGVSCPFSLSKQRAMGMSERDIYLKILRRMGMLILFGLIYNGLFDLNFEHLRWGSVLSRIGIAWAVAAILYVCCALRTRIVISLVILIGYGLLSKFVAAPDVPNADPLTMEGCLAGYIDRLLMSGHLYLGHFDPEGLFSTIPAIVTAMMGIFTGELIRTPQEKISGNQKTVYLLVTGIVLGLLAWIFNDALPINKNLWSSTFVCAVGSYSLIMMALFYYIIDVRGWQQWTFVFRIIGMNSITIYMGQRIIDFNSISNFFFNGLGNLFPQAWSSSIHLAGYVFISWLFLYFLYRQKIFLKI